MTARRRRLWIQTLAVLVAFAFGASDSLARSGGGGRGGGRSEMRGGGGSARAAAHRGGGKSKSINKGGPASRGLGSASRAQRQPRASAKPRASGGGASPVAATKRAGDGNRKLAAARAGEGTRQLAAKRPAAGPRPGAGSRPAAGAAERPNVGERQDNRTERQGNRQEGRTDRTDIRQENRTDRQDNRQDFASDAREDRQDFWDDRIEDVDWNEVDWDHWEVWEDDDFEWGLGTWMTIAVGTAVTAAAWNSMQQQSGCNLQQVEVNDRAYMKCGNTWYIEAWSGEEVHYVAVDPPVGY